MKCRNLIAVAALGLAASCGTPYQATDTTTVVVAPDGVRTAFVTQYPTTSNVVWYKYDAAVATPIDWEMAGWSTLDANDYVVRFNMDNDDYYAWYDETGTWVGTAYVVKDYHTLGNTITANAMSEYPGYTITSVQKEFQKDRVAYEIEMKNADTKVKLLVDGNGTILKRKTKAL
jgi:hypothetical protein